MSRNVKQILRELVSEWQKRPLPKILPREFNMGNWFSGESHVIVCVVGFRRVGKTYLLLDFAQKTGREKCLYLSLEDERLPKTTEVLTELIGVVREFYGRKKLILLLDEIQEIPDWNRWARRVNESQLHHLILSGSSSRLSSLEIPTELRGRTVTKTVFPLSFSEFKTWSGGEDDLTILRQYLNYGGFPAIALKEEGEKQALLDEYFQTFLTRDIVERYRLRQKIVIADLIRLLLAGPYYTIGKLTATLRAAGYKIGKGTVANYLAYLESSYFLKPITIFSPKVKERIYYPKKSYFADLFFVSRLAGNFSQSMGRLMEEAAAGKLFREKAADPHLDFYYWKDYAGNEVDFILRRGLENKEIIQVSYASSPMDIREREIKGLIKCGKELKCNRLTLITWDYKENLRQKGARIVCLPLAEFLLRDFEPKERPLCGSA